MDVQIIVIIITVLIGITGIVLYILSQINKTDEEALRESIAEEYRQACEDEKKSLQENAQELLNKTIQEKDSLIEEEKAKCKDMVASGDMTTQEANKTLQEQLNKAQADIVIVKDELQKQMEMYKQKRVCSHIKDVRKAGGGYMLGGPEDHVIPYGEVTTLEGCEIACKDNLDCKQFVWYEPNSLCYPMNKTYSEGTQDSGFVSGTCSS